jgi:SAM-dependent methyltransferase
LNDSTQNQFEEILKQSISENNCIKIVLSKKRPDSDQVASKINIRPIELKGNLCYQKTSQIKKQSIHENFSPVEMASDVLDLFENHFLNCHLFTTAADYEIRHKKKDGIHINQSKPTLKQSIEPHNKIRQYIIPDDTPCQFLIEVGIMTAEGKVRKSRYSKFRQINRYLELVSDTVPFLPENETIRVIDFGCGKSYLTFALHYYLTDILNRKVQIIGLDWNEHVIRECEKIANKLNITDIHFQTGDIGHFKNSDPVHLAVSLHACDTATDLALAHAISWKTDVILAVPCCQHELFSQISHSQLAPILDHGILRERYSSLATDALRANLMEICGYNTQVIEFIDMEHTAKNVLIRSIRNCSIRNDGEENDSLTQKKETDIAKYKEFKAILGIETFALERELRKLEQLDSFSD